MARATGSFPNAVLLLAVALILPGWAAAPWLARFGWAPLAVPLALSAASFAAYGLDKRRAERREARFAEASLLTLDLLGGWPGGLVAQRLWRHKTAKASYQFVFWLIVAIYQAVAAWALFG
jgi:uncharacterized membrane protein YsdA (DUF1294 family)